MDSDNLIRLKGVTIGLATNDCVLWPLSVNNSGYGMKYDRSSGGKRAYLAHRWVYERVVGPIPEGMVLDHTCRVKDCVNPAHLDLVDTVTNNERAALVRRANSEAREFCVNGHRAQWFRKGSSGHLRCRQCDRTQQARARAKRKAVRANPAV